MNKFSLGLAIAFVLLPATQGSGQVSNPTPVLDRAGALQSKLSQWRQTLGSMNLNLPRFTRGERNLLERERSACLSLIDAVGRDITDLQGKVSPEEEVRVHLDANRLQGRLFSLHDSLNSLNSLAFGNGNLAGERSVLGRVGEIGEMASVLESFFEQEGQVMRQLDAIGVELTAPKPQQLGEVSGHVYRADTGKPLAGVRVMLGVISSFGPPFRTVPTGPDGAYAFSEVPPGQYRIAAYLKGFTYGQYGPTDRFGPGWETISLASGQQLSTIDMRLHPLVSVTPMNEEALVGAFGAGRFWLKFSPGSFSPDGKLFAFGVGDPDPYQAWLYDMSSRRLSPVTSTPTEGWPQIRGMTWVGESLYADAYYPNHDQCFVASAAGTTQLAELPAAAEEAFTKGNVRDFATPMWQANNDRFTVAAQDQGHGSFTLTARAAHGGGIFQIAGGSWELGSFVFDSRRSVVIFPRFYSPAIALCDLNTRQIREAYLPNRAEHLLDAKPELGGYLVAYASYGPCQGYGDQGSFYPIHPPRAPYNVCFAMVPFEEKK